MVNVIKPISLPYAKVIVNPVAGAYSTRRNWLRISRLLREIGLSFDYEYTEGVGHAVELARVAAGDGYRYVVAVGGDGTVNEVANGILGSTAASSIALGVISTGTGSNFARSVGIPRHYVSACSSLGSWRRSLIDVGVVEYRSKGQSSRRFFVNVADIGFGAAIVDDWKRLPNRFGRKTNYTLRWVEGFRTLSTHRNKWLKLRVGNKVEAVCICAVVIANGRYFADRMQIAPHARLDDGLLDVVTIGDVGRFELLKILPTLYSGSHIGHPKISEKKTTTVTIESDEQLLVEADGELLGECPASFWLMPAALTIVV